DERMPDGAPLAWSPLSTTLDGTRCEALFASELQRSDAPTAESVTEAISRTVRRLGTRGCAGRMAQESGDHPQAAAERMRWVRQLAAGTAAPGDLRARARGGRAGPPGSPQPPPPRRPRPRPAGARPAWRDPPRQLLTSATRTEGTRHSEADTGPAAP